MCAAGEGIRFKNDYSLPKPFIKVEGVPMWEKAIHFWLDKQNISSINVVFNKKHKPYFEYTSNSNINFCWLDETTGGMAETCYYGIVKLNLNFNEPIVFIDCDSSIDFVFEQWNFNCNGSFITKSSSPKHSYVIMDNKNKITKIKEKEVISNNANTGHYWFSSANLYIELFNEIKARNLKTKNEYYISNVIDVGLTKNIDFFAHEVKLWNCWGTPEQLKDFLNKNDHHSS